MKTLKDNMMSVANKNNLSLTFLMRSSNSLLIARKERNNLDREVGILNEVLAEQGATLRKYQL